MVMNNKAWIRIIEAVVAILLVAGVLLIVIGQGYFGKQDMSSQFYDIEASILREIQLDDDLRADILNSNPPLEIDDTGFPSSVKERIESRVPNYLECTAKICGILDDCELDESPEEEIYAEAVAITTTLETDPEKQLKQLKIFCWSG